MERHTKRIYYRIFAGSIIATSLLFSFQNCGQQPLQESITSSSDAQNAELQELISIFGTQDAKKVQGLPFLYDASINQITFSSCNLKGSTSQEDLFTIRAGAYDPIDMARGNSGVKIRDELFSTLALDFKPRHPNTELIDYDFKRMLYHSPKNKNVQIQFALRETGNLLKRMDKKEGMEETNFEPLDPLTGDAYLTSLMNVNLEKQDHMIKYFTFADQNKRQLQSYNSLPGVKSTFSATNIEEDLAFGIRQHLKLENYIFTLNFIQNNEIDTPLSPHTDENKKSRSIYGRGYKLNVTTADNFFTYCKWKKNTLGQDCSFLENTFETTPGFFSASMNKPNYYLKDVKEVDLENGFPTGNTWKCDSLRRYIIVRDMVDAIDNAICPTDDISELNDSQRLYYFRELEIVRKHLPEHAWHVSIYRRCVTPKNPNTQCYKREIGENKDDLATYNKLIPVQYNQTAPCVWDGSSNNPPNVKNKCAHVISICVRQ